MFWKGTDEARSLWLGVHDIRRVLCEVHGAGRRGSSVVKRRWTKLPGRRSQFAVDREVSCERCTVEVLVAV